MKWLGAIVSLLICLVAAIIVWQRSQRRVQYYADLVDFCHSLRNEISYALKPLPLIITEYANHYHVVLNDLLQRYWQLLQQKSDITYERCQDLTEDRDVAAFLYHLGRMGCTEEQNKITTAQQIFTDKHRQAVTYLQSKTSIISKLLIIIGIAGVILWI